MQLLLSNRAVINLCEEEGENLLYSFVITNMIFFLYKKRIKTVNVFNVFLSNDVLILSSWEWVVNPALVHVNCFRKHNFAVVFLTAQHF